MSTMEQSWPDRQPIPIQPQEASAEPVRVETPPITDYVEVKPESDSELYALPIAELKERAFNPKTKEFIEQAHDYMTSELLPDGTQKIVLATGETFLGNSPEELLRKVVQSKINTNLHLQSLKAQQPQTEEQPPEQQPIPQDQLEQFQKRLAFESLGSAFGVPPEQVPQLLQEHRQAEFNWRLNTTYMDFLAQCPDYMETPTNNSALLSYLPSDRLPTVSDMRTAWAQAIYDRKATPYRPAQEATAPRPPAVMPSPSTSEHVGSFERNPWQMPIAELRKLALEK